MASSANRFILIGIGVAALGVAAYYIYNLLNEDSPSGQLARARLGLDKAPGAGILQDPSVKNYQPDPRFGGYQNKSKGLIEDPNTPYYIRDLYKNIENARAQQYYGKSNAGFLYNSLAVEEERPEPWASLMR